MNSRIRVAILATTLAVVGCTDVPTAPAPESPDRLEYILALPPSYAVNDFQGMGMDPKGVIVVGLYSFYSWVHDTPGHWHPHTTNFSLMGAPPVPGTVHTYETMLTNSNYIAVATAYMEDQAQGCRAFYWRGYNSLLTQITRHVLPDTPHGCLRVRGVGDAPRTDPLGQGPFTIVGFAGPAHHERAYRVEVSATDVVTVVELPLPPVAGVQLTRANALDQRAGMVVGTFWTPDLGYRVVSWSLSDDSPTDWGIPGEATAVNKSGAIVGNNLDDHTGFVSNGPGESTPIKLGNIHTRMTGIADNGTVIGNYSHFGVPETGFVIRNGQLTEREGYLFRAISRNGQILAWKYSGGVQTMFGSGIHGSFLLQVQPDADNDGLPNVADNCPGRANPDQADADEDGIGDYCDPDMPPVVLGLTASPESRPEGGWIKVRWQRMWDPGGHGHVGMEWEATGAYEVVGQPRGADFWYRDSGADEITLRLTNAVGNTSEHRVNVTIANVAPKFDLIQVDTVVALGTPTTLRLRLVDPGLNDQISYEVDWLDGTVETFVCTHLHYCQEPFGLTHQHTYAAKGLYKPLVTARDSDGGVRAKRLIVRVY